MLIKIKYANKRLDRYTIDCTLCANNIGIQVGKKGAKEHIGENTLKTNFSDCRLSFIRTKVSFIRMTYQKLGIVYCVVGFIILLLLILSFLRLLLFRLFVCLFEWRFHFYCADNSSLLLSAYAGLHHRNYE